jgi:hypothetical protein
VLPPGVDYDRKYVYGIVIETAAGTEVERGTEASELIGCADLIRGWPSPSTVLIGLIFAG